MHTMDTRNTTRDEIIRVGAEILGEKGFNAAGIDAVLKSAGVPKGSFYYYFPSKEEFGLAVLDRFARDARAHVEGFLADTTLRPLARIEKFFRSEGERLECEGCRKGCMLGNLSQEMAGQHDRFRERLDQIWTGWQRIVAGCLAEAVDAGELSPDTNVNLVAEFLIMGLEGAIIRAKVMRSGQPIQDFTDLAMKKVLI